MPTYAYKCFNGHTTNLVRKIDERDAPASCWCGQDSRREEVSYFAFSGLFKPYVSPVSGREITSRGAEVDECLRHGKIIAEPGLERDISRWGQEQREKAEASVDQAVASELKHLDF